jgi:hypothetical protein
MEVRRSLTPLAAIGCLLVAGCGGDESGGYGGGNERTASTAWVQDANGICRQARERSVPLPEKLGLDPNSRGNRKARAIAEKKLEQLRAVERPDEVARDFDRISG